MDGRLGRWLEGLTPGRAAWMVAVVGALVYANSLANGFAYDDVAVVANNETIQSWERLGSALFSPYWPIAGGAELALWRPVITGLFGVQYILGGGSPFPFHLLNVLLHAAVSGVLVLLLARLTTVAAAWVAGLIFAVHPVHTEAVANVVGQAELVAALAVLSALLVHVRCGSTSSWRAALGVGVLYAIGFGAKESAVTLLGLVFLLDAARERIGFRELPAYVGRRWRVYFVMVVVAVAMLSARAVVLGGHAAPRGPAGFQLLYDIPKIWTLGEVWTHYVRLWVFPLELSSDYTPNVIPVSLGWHPINVTGVAVVLAVLVGTLVAWRRPALAPGVASAKLAAFGVLWFLVAISPTSNTLFLTGVMLAERTLYLPTVGLAAAVGWLFVRLARERMTLAPTLLVAVLVLGAIRTWVRNPEWMDQSTVFTVMARDYPHSGRVQWILGDEFLKRGQVDEALFAYRAAVDLLDADYALLTHVAQALIELDRFRAADGVLHYALQQRSDHPLAFGLRAGVRAEMGDAMGTLRFARASLALQPRDPIRLHVMAWALASRGSWVEAAEARRRAEAFQRVSMWQPWVHDALLARRRGDQVGMLQALDSARTYARSSTGRAALDSILVHDFGMEPAVVEEAPEAQATSTSADPGSR